MAETERVTNEEVVERVLESDRELAKGHPEELRQTSRPAYMERQAMAGEPVTQPDGSGGEEAEAEEAPKSNRARPRSVPRAQAPAEADKPSESEDPTPLLHGTDTTTGESKDSRTEPLTGVE